VFEVEPVSGFLCIEKKMAVDINIVIYNGDFVEKV
jgi:hypothetical protein